MVSKAMATSSTASGKNNQSKVGERYNDDKLKHDIRISNMTAAKKTGGHHKDLFRPSRHG